MKKGKNRKKRAKFNLSTLGFVYSKSLCIQNLNTVALIDSELIRWKKNVGKKEKRTNKETDKPYVANSFLHSTTCHT